MSPAGTDGAWLNDQGMLLFILTVTLFEKKSGRVVPPNLERSCDSHLMMRSGSSDVFTNVSSVTAAHVARASTTRAWMLLKSSFSNHHLTRCPRTSPRKAYLFDG